MYTSDILNVYITIDDEKDVVMKLRFLTTIVALTMTIALCGCEVDLDVSPVTQQNGQVTVTTGGTQPSSDVWDDGAKKTTTVQTTVSTKAYATLPVLQRNPKYDNEFGMHHTLLCYTFTDVHSKNRWLPSVGYIKDGEIKGVMYDSFIILPSPYHVYFSGQLADKKGWDRWREHNYANLETLNQAVKEVQDALNLKDYKVKVFLSLWKPENANHGNWGMLNGTSYSAKNAEQSFDMVKYMVDSYNAEMATKEFANLDYAGFYWFDESFDTEMGDWYRRVTDYVHSTGKMIVHAPYYKSKGWQYSHLYGMDLVAMQSNYFHNKPIESEYTARFERLAENAANVRDGGGVIDGMTIECTTADDHDDMTTLKHTMKTVLEHGIEDGYYIYYFGGGASAPYVTCHSENAYIRSGYDELYRFINKTLTVESMNIEEYVNPQGGASNE